jgi:hypothetical protein
MRNTKRPIALSISSDTSPTLDISRFSPCLNSDTSEKGNLCSKLDDVETVVNSGNVTLTYTTSYHLTQ